MNGVAKHFTKRVLARGLLRTPCWNVILWAWACRDWTVVLTYHRVLEKWDSTLDYSQPGMVVTVPTFERQLAFLDRYFEIGPLGELDGHAIRTRGRRPRCVITFDDGWRDNHDLALPILHKLRLPATIFLTTDFVGTERVFWHTELVYLILQTEFSHVLGDEQTMARYPVVVRERLRRCAGSPSASRVEDADALVETLKTTCDEIVIRGLIQTLSQAAGIAGPLFPARRFFLDWDQVAEMAANGFEIGSHGCSHRIMTRLSPKEAHDELVRSKAEIERRLGRTVDHFAFPNENANETLITLAGQAGYRTACVADGVDRVARSGIRAMGRFGMHEGLCVEGTECKEELLGLGLLRAPKSKPA